MSDLLRAVQSVLDGLDDLETAESFYEGKAPEVYTSGKLARLLKDTGAKFRVNWARTTVTAVLNRLEINAITCSDDALTDVIQQVWNDNELDIEAPQIHEAALEYGVTYLVVDLDSDDEVVLYHNSPKNVRLFYSRENPRKKEFAVKVWSDAANRMRVNLYYPTVTLRFVSKKPVSSETVKREDNFKPFEEDGNDWEIPNPYGEVPVFDFVAGKKPYGRPEHLEAYGPQNMLNKLVATQMATVDFSSFPQKWVMLDGTTEDVGDGIDWDDDAPGSKTTEPVIETGPGITTLLKNAKAAGQWDSANPSAFLDPIKSYITAMAQATDTPIHAYQDSGIPPTGNSRRMAEQPLLKKVNARQMSFGSSWKQVFKFVLRLSGYELGDNTLTVSWERAGSIDDSEYWTLVSDKVAAGVPRRQALLEAGYTPEEVDTFGWTENRSELLNAPVEQTNFDNGSVE